MFLELDNKVLDEPQGSEVIVFNTDSRWLTPEEAYEKVSFAAHLLHRIDARFFYKKIDSTLRGNIGSEIDAFMDVICFAGALVAPAFLRWEGLLLGRQFIGCSPVNQTEVAF